jgi:hypothetical protein
LADLESALVHDWDFIRNDVAIRDFLEYCDMLGRETGLFLRVGKGFSRKLLVDFVKESEEYINSMTCMSYHGDTFVHRYKISAFKSFITKLRTKFGKNNAKQMYLSRVTEDEFIDKTTKYIYRLFENFARINNVNTIILDQAIPPESVTKNMRYYQNSKLIIVDRDPRDIYCNMVRGNGLLGSELIEKDSAEKYITWHNSMRWKSNNYINLKDKVLKINFEDLVVRYEETTKLLSDFLDSRPSKDKQFSYFNPEFSLKNVGLWKAYPNQEIMREIEKHLPNECLDI